MEPWRIASFPFRCFGSCSFGEPIAVSHDEECWPVNSSRLSTIPEDCGDRSPNPLPTRVTEPLSTTLRARLQ